MPNRLAAETSPYLRQHSANPVDWYPWGEEAFERSRSEDKPILLSIGYSACHWCHVMAHESFENAAIAEILNRYFVSIKVDREERPDVDQIYMEAVQSMVGSGGWPLTVFLTPQLRPFYGGTYFPPRDYQNRPSFSRVLLSVVDAYKNRRDKVEGTAQEISLALSRGREGREQEGAPGEQDLAQAMASIESSYDREMGGFGGAPKFPHPMTLEFLLRYYLGYGHQPALEMVRQTLDKMAMGGMYDQIGGGFHRYSTDRNWLVPHFEKMLYDNALLSRAYLQGFAVTGYQPYARIAAETLDYLLREMKEPGGGFYSAQDADSEGHEGLYYLWSLADINGALDERAAGAVAEHFGVSAKGNFEGRNILHARDLEPGPEVEKARKVLLALRQKRIKPATDDKQLASWNALTVISLAEAAGQLARPDYREAAERTGEFLRDSLVVGGALMHTFKDGRAKVPAFLEDYALTATAFLALHGLTAEGGWLEEALRLTEKMTAIFTDRQSGLLYDTPAGQADLFFRPRSEYDGATPSGASAATFLLIKMAAVTGKADYLELAETSLKAVRQNMSQAPLGVSQWLCALDLFLAAPLEIAIVGGRKDERTESLLRTLNSLWLPGAVTAALDPSGPGSLKELPLFQGRVPVGGRPAVYICHRNTCQQPITQPEALHRELSTLVSRRQT